jgi:eukaryotic-like serine/threonine-protein kinase
MTVEEIFLVAVEKPADERAAYLDAACAGNTELRAQVDALVRSHDRAGGLLEKPLFRTAPTIDHAPPAAESGAVIGPYKLVEQIGEGGMGTVWMAQQAEPVKRLVALKLIKAGMDSRQVIARFEAERQALALMDHANIARVLDAGTTDAGRPYFVMDLVKGEPITKYCDEHHLTPRQRLELFLPVCQAVQHAHQKGIIHRDIKPSNVMIALYDGRPVPKVIDFGVAKAAGPPLTDKTLVTGFGAIVGTLEYMSPEQAELNQLDIDTRSDIYSLGVLLYELLTGTTPLEPLCAEESGFLEVLRIIREEEVPTLSKRLSTTSQLPAIAARRGLEPGKLTRLVRGELDWIVMKALEKDRSRRYETASGLAADVQRYLAGETVHAVPPSAGYRLRMFARRYKRSLAVVALLALVLLGATATSVGLASWALTERKLAGAKEKEARDRAEELRAVLDFVDNQILAAARPLGQEGGLGRQVTLRQAIESALPYIEESFRDRPLIEARLLETIAASFLYLGDGKAAEMQFERCRAIRTAMLGPDHPDTLFAMNRLGYAYYVQGRYRDALVLQEETLTLQKVRLGSDHPDTLKTMGNVATDHLALAQADKAVAILEKVLELQNVRLGADHADTLRTLSNLAEACRFSRREDAVKYGEEAVRRLKAKYSPDHPATLHSIRFLAKSYAAVGRHADALNLREETLRLRKDRLGLHHHDTLISMRDLADSYQEFGRHEEALELQEHTLPLMKTKFGAGAFETLDLLNELVQSYTALGRHEDAAKAREELQKYMKNTHGHGSPGKDVRKGDGK